MVEARVYRTPYRRAGGVVAGQAFAGTEPGFPGKEVDRRRGVVLALQPSLQPGQFRRRQRRQRAVRFLSAIAQCHATAFGMGEMGCSKPLYRSALMAGLAAALLLLWPARPAAAQALVLSRTIELQAVQGRLDHMDIDLDGARLFVAALAAGSVEVIDVRGAARIARIDHLHEPQGVAYLTQGKRLFIANGTGAGVDVYEGAKRIAVVGGLEDADNMQLDPAAGRLYVGYGNALAILDPGTMQVVRRVALAGHPEAFELATMGPQIYVNVPSARQIAVVDRRSGKVTATWNVTGAAQNFPMALDEPRHRLFVATRQPAMLLVYDTATGRRIAALPVCGDADDLFFDSARRQLYAVCGEGVVDVVRQRDADQYEVAERLQTSPGARTGLFVPRLATLFVAVPSHSGSPAEIRAYRAR